MKLIDRLLFIIPHWITEDVIFEERDDGWYPVCSAADVQPGEWFEKVATIKSLTFMNNCYFPAMVGDLRDYIPPTRNR